MISIRTPLLLLGLAACPPAPSATDTQPASVPEPIVAPRTVVRSCPADPKPRAVDFNPRFSLGDLDGITWLYGESAGGPVLAHLGADDSLVLTPVPLRGAEAGAIDGARLWLYTSQESARWLSVDIRDPDKPVPGAITPVITGAHNHRADKLAVGPTRALGLFGERNAQRDLVLLDTATATSVAPPQPLPLTLGPVHAFCGDDTCSLVAVDHEPIDDVTDRLIVLRVLADGSHERELISPEWSGQPQVARHGDQLVIAWSTHNTIRLRALDRGGHPLGASVPVPWDSKRWIHDIRLLHSDGAVLLAVGEQTRWSVALVGPHGNPGPLRELPGADRRFLFGAPLADGLAWINVGDGVDRDEPGVGVLMGAWQVEAVGGFLPTTGAAPAPTQLASDNCGHEGGFDPYILTRPGAAAALVIPRGDADISLDPSLTVLRTTCKPAPPTVGVDEVGVDERCREAPAAPAN